MVILYHNDVDGIVSAAAYIYGNKLDSYILRPVKSVDRCDIQDVVDSYDDDVVVLDYARADGAYFWCDHHWDTRFEGLRVDSETTLYDSSAKSAASLLLTSDHKTLSSMVDMVDSASYPCAQYVFESEDYIVKFKRIVDRYCDNEIIMNRLVNSLVIDDLDIYRVVDNHGVDSSILMNESIVAAKIAGAKMDTIGDISVLRCLSTAPRYSEFYVDKNIKFSIRVHHVRGNEYKISVGSNPWIENDKNIGKILRDCKYVKNGGGHIGVGGGMVIKRKVDRAISSIIESLS